MLLKKKTTKNNKLMKIFKTINGSKVSYHTDLRNATKSNPTVIIQTRGLIVPTH